MNGELQARLTAEIQDHVRAGTNHLSDEEFYNPVTSYASATRSESERDRLFRRYPIVAGHASRLSQPGAFLTYDVAGLPIVVVRDGDGAVSAFLNVCRHRGAKVVEAAHGVTRRLTCPYHSWSYDLKGGLAVIPDESAFCGVDRDQRGLVELPTEVRHGLVWVLLEGEDLDVASYLGPLDDELASFGLDAYVEERLDSLRTNVNWKLVVDGFLEAYHLPFLHSQTIGPYIRQKPTMFEPFGIHGRMVAVRKSFERHVDADPVDVDLLPHIAIIYQLFPNTILVWQADHFEMWNCFPDGPDPGQSLSRASLLAPDAQQAAERTDYWDSNWKVLMNTVEQEDFRVARTMQAGYSSGAQSHVVFGRNEPALQHFHRNLADLLASQS